MIALLDPCAVACHTDLAGAQVNDAVSALVDAAVAARNQTLRILVSENLFATLSSAGLFPLREKYGEVLESAHIDTISGTDLASLVLEMLQRAEILESTATQFEVNSCTCALVAEWANVCDCHPDMDEVTEQTFHAYAAYELIDSDSAAIFLLSPRSRPVTFSITVEFRAVLSKQEELFENTGVEINLPIARNATHALEWLHPERLLAQFGLREDSVTLAINAKVRQLTTDTVPANWSMGTHFISDLRALNILRVPGLAQRVLRACTEILLGSAQPDSHWLRKSRSGNAAQIKRSGWAAWRQDVDHDIHLHYWMAEDGRIQLASIAGHNVFTIPDP